ncbi:MAG: membrane protein insertase YidC [Cutibacterium sp.]|nr:membrane protein insertase YidC [Cutibacterium sp.]
MQSLANAIADFFARLFDPIVDVLGAVLSFFHYELGLEWWLSIVLLTVVVRALLFPLTLKQMKSMRAMQELRPEIQRIQRQYRDNPQLRNQEMMKLYQERKVNPLGGCLPLLVQMPIFIGIFYVIREFGGYSYGGRVVEPSEPTFETGGILWFQDLSQMDPYYILPILSALTMLAGTEISAKYMEPQQRWIMRIVPFAITLFLWNFPAGLFVYWISNNLVTIVQNYFIYNYGPGKREERSAEKRGERPVETHSSPDSTEEDPQKRAAKTAKRKRRKKKR